MISSWNALKASWDGKKVPIIPPFHVSNELITYFEAEINIFNTYFSNYRGSHPEVFLGKGCLKICSKFTKEYPCRSVISIHLQSIFIEITLWHGCSPANLLHIFRTPFLKITSGWLLLKLVYSD